MSTGCAMRQISRLRLGIRLDLSLGVGSYWIFSSQTSDHGEQTAVEVMNDFMMTSRTSSRSVDVPPYRMVSRAQVPVRKCPERLPTAWAYSI